MPVFLENLSVLCLRVKQSRRNNSEDPTTFFKPFGSLKSREYYEVSAVGESRKKVDKLSVTLILCNTLIMQWRSWLRHCATNRNVAGSIPYGVTGIFQWLNPSVRIVALGSTQPLTEMSTRNPSWEWRRTVRRADNLATFMCRLSRNCGDWASWNPKSLSRSVAGNLYLTLLIMQCLNRLTAEVIINNYFLFCGAISTYFGPCRPFSRQPF
jgi:hypothetical protein